MGVVLLALMSGAAGDARAQVASEKARANDERVGETASSEGRPSLRASDSDALGEPVRVTSGLMRRPVYDGIGRKVTALHRALQRRAVAQGAGGQEAPEVGSEDPSRLISYIRRASHLCHRLDGKVCCVETDSGGNRSFAGYSRSWMRQWGER